MRQKLTDLAIQKLPFAAKGNQKYWDEVLPGFGIRTTAKSKSFFIVYGKERRLKTIGKYPATSLQTARKEARLLLASHSSSKPTMGLQEAIERFLAECEEKNRPATVTQYRLYLRGLKRKRIEEVVRSDVGNKPHAIMSAKVFFNWCIRNRLTDHNPFALERVSYPHRDRVLSNDEIKLVWDYEHPVIGPYIKVLLLTGQRRGQFTDFEIRDDELFFPARNMKGKRDHTVPLLSMAREYAQQIQPYNGWSKAKARIDKVIDIPHWTFHDLRRTHSTIQASLGTPIHVTEAILSHTSGTISGVARTYNRYNYLTESRTALEKFEQHLQTLIA